MSYWRPISLLIVLLALSSSASTSSALDKLQPIHGGIQFTLAERPPGPESADVPMMYLSMHTDEIYGCCNYSLVQETVVGSEELSVKLKGIYMPDICLTAPGPALSSHTLDIPLIRTMLRSRNPPLQLVHRKVPLRQPSARCFGVPSPIHSHTFAERQPKHHGCVMTSSIVC